MHGGILAGLMALAVMMTGLDSVFAEGRYDTGASDTDIKIGQTIGYSAAGGGQSAFGKVQTAYFDRLNAEGGINGRKIILMSMDDGYSPPKTVEVIRELVEQDGVLAISGSNGTATNLAVRPYLEAKGVPQLFLISGAFNDPKNHPTVTIAAPTYLTEGKIYAKYILEQKPEAKIAILYQNDDFGKDFVKGLKEVLADRAETMIVSEASYDRSEPTIASQISQLAASNADVLFNVSFGKFAAQSIKRVNELGWKPLHILNYGAAAAIFQMPESERHFAEGIVGMTYYKDPGSAEFANDPDVKAYKDFLAKWAPDVHPTDTFGLTAYTAAAMLEHTLKEAGNDLTRANIVGKAVSIKGLSLPILLPGITINTNHDNYEIFNTVQLQRFDGKNWKLLGETVSLK